MNFIFSAYFFYFIIRVDCISTTISLNLRKQLCLREKAEGAILFNCIYVYVYRLIIESIVKYHLIINIWNYYRNKSCFRRCNLIPINGTVCYAPHTCFPMFELITLDREYGSQDDDEIKKKKKMYREVS